MVRSTATALSATEAAARPRWAAADVELPEVSPPLATPKAASWRAPLARGAAEAPTEYAGTELRSATLAPWAPSAVQSKSSGPAGAAAAGAGVNATDLSHATDAFGDAASTTVGTDIDDIDDVLIATAVGDLNHLMGIRNLSKTKTRANEDPWGIRRSARGATSVGHSRDGGSERLTESESDSDGRCVFIYRYILNEFC